MAKAGDTVIRMSRKGMMVWIGLMLFLAVWMFVLGILVGRGIAPVNLEAGKLEQELAALKARMLRQEQTRVDARVSGQGGGKTELEFYEVLKDPKQEKPFKPVPKPLRQPEPQPVEKAAVKPVKPVAVPTPKPAVRPESKPVLQSKPAPAPKEPPQSGKFTVQVAAVKDAHNAERLVAELRKKGYRAYQIRTEVSGKGVWYRVRTGAFTDRRIAEKTAAKLKADRYGAMVVGTQ